MARITIDIPEDLKLSLERFAIKTGQSLDEVVVGAITHVDETDPESPNALLAEYEARYGALT